MRDKLIVVVLLIVGASITGLIYAGSARKETNATLPGQLVTVQGNKQFSGAMWGEIGIVCGQGGYDLLVYAGQKIVIKSSLALGKFYERTLLDENIVFSGDQIVCRYYSDKYGKALPGIFAWNDPQIFRLW